MKNSIYKSLKKIRPKALHALVFRQSPKTYLSLAACSLVLFMLYGFFIASPLLFPVNRVVVIPRGSTLTDIAHQLYIDHLLRSPFFFRVLVKLDRSDAVIKAGAYQFDSPLSAFGVVSSLLYGKHEVNPIKVTFPEGATVKEMAALLEQKIPDFDESKFVALGTPKEGYLFPDTYLITPGTSVEEIISLMEDTFAVRMETVLPEISNSNASLKELIIMASLLEKEARTFEVRQTIAGILWRRLEINMPLQVDAVFGYIRGTNTFHPSYADLEVESPYNTYRNKGLPPGAIGNPGLESIRAAAKPIKTKYLFYLSDREGRMHYSANFDGHILNRVLYLES